MSLDEEGLAREVTAFLQRVQREDTHHTFEHPEDWDSLSMEEKAYLIVEDKAVKLMELQCQGRVTGQQEAGNTTNHESGPLYRKPDNLGEGAINLDKIPRPARRYDPSNYTRRMQAEDMKNAKAFLQQGPLTVARIEKFDLWKKDILQATQSVNLTEQEHWATINKII